MPTCEPRARVKVGARGGGPTVQIVEDELVVALDLSERLSAMGYQVTGIASSATEALANVKAHLPDLVMMDIRIDGDLDGIDTATMISGQFDVPVVFLTANADAGTIARARSAAPHGYLMKPFEERTVRSAIDIALDRHAAEVGLRRLKQASDAHAAGVERAMNVLGAIHEMLELVLSSESPAEVAAIVARFAALLFGGNPGALYLLDRNERMAEAETSWAEWTTEPVFAAEDCWALRRGRTHHVRPGRAEPRCRHSTGDQETLCVPVMAGMHSYGVLCLTAPSLPAELSALVVRFAHQAALALTNAALCERLRRESIIDPLTGLFNRRHMADALQKEIRRASRKQQSMSIVMLDIDHFKQLNDDYGHPVGDQVLRDLGALVRKRVRAYDVPCRIGGEELLILLPACDLVAALGVAQDLRAEIAGVRVSSFGSTIASPTASFGVACYPAHGETADALVAAADRALYQAKATGRDRICTVPIAS